MREIKFRAWHKELKWMFSPEEMGQDQLTLMPDGRGFANVSSDSVHRSYIDDGRKMIPLQYTGIKDGNGKEICEGDIVRYGLEDEIVSCIIEYAEEAHDNEACPYMSGFIYRVISSKEYPENDDSDYSLEVIGNIYENPELLGEKCGQ